jgi:hypothetical protein
VLRQLLAGRIGLEQGRVVVLKELRVDKGEGAVGNREL